jgi:hypothetical protein
MRRLSTSGMMLGLEASFDTDVPEHVGFDEKVVLKPGVARLS